MTDAQYVEMAEGLNAALQATGGASFTETPLVYHEPLNTFFKVEVNNAGQSHKARHLANAMLYLLAHRNTGDVDLGKRRLAVASCGNAGLAAAEVAAAAEWPIDVCIPPDADEAVKRRLLDLAPKGVAMLICDRSGHWWRRRLGRCRRPTLRTPPSQSCPTSSPITAPSLFGPGHRVWPRRRGRADAGMGDPRQPQA